MEDIKTTLLVRKIYYCTYSCNRHSLLLVATSELQSCATTNQRHH